MSESFMVIADERLQGYDPMMSRDDAIRTILNDELGENGYTVRRIERDYDLMASIVELEKNTEQ